MKSLTRGTCLPPGHDFSGVEHCHLCSGVYRKKNGEGTGALQWTPPWSPPYFARCASKSRARRSSYLLGPQTMRGWDNSHPLAFLILPASWLPTILSYNLPPLRHCLWGRLCWWFLPWVLAISLPLHYLMLCQCIYSNGGGEAPFVCFIAHRWSLIAPFIMGVLPFTVHPMPFNPGTS